MGGEGGHVCKSVPDASSGTQYTGRDADAEFSWKWWPGTTFVETVYLVLRRAVSNTVPVFERIGWTYQITRRSVAGFHRSAGEMKFMLV
jgi:hypothetical protein